MLKLQDSDFILSIITVSYNSCDKLKSTLESIRKQNLSDVEVVVVDGKSNDNTSAVVNCYSDIIDVFICESDDGIYDAMNKGISVAKGEWVYFLNTGDTFVNSGVLAGSIANLDDDLDLVISRVVALRSNESPQVFPKLDTIGMVVNHEARIYFDKHLCHQSYFVKRSKLLEQGSFDLKYPHFADFASVFKLMLGGNFRVNNDLIAFYPLDGVSCDVENSQVLLKEKEELLSNIFQENKFCKLYYRLKNYMFCLKMKVGL